MKTSGRLVLLLMLALPAAGQAQFAYSVVGSNATITGYTGTGGIVSIPGTISNLTVNSIGGGAFSGCGGLTGVTIPSSVVTIGNNAFLDCTGLTEVTIPSSVTSIGLGAFGGCVRLASITVDALSSSYVAVDGVLFNRNKTTLVQYPAGKSGSYAVPGGINSIIASAFFKCAKLTSVTIPPGVTTIRNWTFSGCRSLTRVTLPVSITSIGSSAFSDCTSLADIAIPGGVTSIGNNAFLRCAGLAAVTILPGVTNIGNSAFSDCSNLTGVYFSGNAPSMGTTVFAGDSEATVFCLSGTAGWAAPFGGLPLVTYTTNSGQAIITGHDGSCRNVAIPGTLADLPVSRVGANALAGCTNLTRVTIPAGVTNIMDNAFGGCVNLAAVYFDGDAPTLGTTVFNGDSVATVFCLSGTAGWVAPFGGLPLVLCATNGSEVTIMGFDGPCLSVTIPSTLAGLPVTGIRAGAFLDCISLTNATIAASVTNIGDRAFQGCSSLMTVCFGGNAPTIGEHVFGSADQVTVYYQPGAAGWSMLFAGRPAMLPPSPWGGCSLLASSTHLLRITTMEAVPATSPPAFWLIFSTSPLTNSVGNHRETISELEMRDFQRFYTSGDLLALRVHGKTGGGDLRTFEYRFGEGTDATSSWNSGEAFDWHNWSRYSDQVWDNLVVALDPTTPAPQGQLHVTDIAIIRNSETLFDSARTQSSPNLRPMSVVLPPCNLAAGGDDLVLLNLARPMEQFRSQFYEAGSDLLRMAFHELGQADESVFARPGAVWCSEFVAYTYLRNGFSMPNPFTGDVYWKSLRNYFSANGRVHPVRDVITWSDEAKQRLIVPGSMMSIRWADGSTHSILFCAWRPADANGLSSFTAIAGNTGNRVHWYPSWQLPTIDSFTNMTADEIADYDQKAFFGVPDYAAYARTVVPPQLHIGSAPDGLELTWPDFGAHCCYTLEQRMDLRGGAWEGVGTVSQMVGVSRWPVCQLPSGTGFFRLRTDVRALIP